MLQTQTNKHTIKEVVMEDDLDKEAKVEVVLEEETTDAKDSNSPLNDMVSRIVLFTKAQNTSGRTSWRTPKVL